MADERGVGAEGRGVLITLEGGEGAGKSTQIRRLQARLRTLGHDVVATREPGGSPRAEAIREILLGGRVQALGPAAEAVLFAAARADHVGEIIEPALARGAIVLCDRYIDSTRVYQGAVAGVPVAELDRLEAATLGRAVPDLTLVLDLPAEEGMARATARAAGGAPDRFEREGLAYHRRVRDAFLTIARGAPDRCRVVDARLPPDEVEAAIWSALRPLLDRSAPHAG